MSGITGVVNANEDAYQDYIDANPDSFSSPATLAEVQAMITAVNTQANILAQIGNEGDNPDKVNSVVTAAQLASLSGITGVVNANEDAYQDYIDANPDLFSSPATLAEVQAMITAVNTAQANILAQIGTHHVAHHQLIVQRGITHEEHGKEARQCHHSLTAYLNQQNDYHKTGRGKSGRHIDRRQPRDAHRTGGYEQRVDPRYAVHRAARQHQQPPPIVTGKQIGRAHV